MHSSALDNPHYRSDRTTSPQVRRLMALAVGVCCAALLTIAMIVAPSSQGLGTHEQLNLPTCGWITMMDLPCMTCGMTTAFSHAVRGNFFESLLTQPMGFVLAMGTAITLLISLHVAVTGSKLAGLFGRFYSARVMWLLVAFAAASWVFKILTYKGFFV